MVEHPSEDGNVERGTPMTGHTPEDRDRLMVQVFMILQRIGAFLFRSDLKPEEVEETSVQEVGAIAQDVAEFILSRLRGLGDGRIIDEVINSNEIRLVLFKGYDRPLYLVRPIKVGETKKLADTLEALRQMGYEPRGSAGLIDRVARFNKDLWRSRIKTVNFADIWEEFLYQLDISATGARGHEEGTIIDFTGRDWFLAFKE